MMKNHTYFFDIDGTLIKYRAFADIKTVEPEPIKSSIELLNREYESGNHIVITSARPQDLMEFTKKELNKLGINYHQIVLGIGRGVRFIVNDIDPLLPEYKRAVGLNLERDKGFEKSKR